MIAAQPGQTRLRRMGSPAQRAVQQTEPGALAPPPNAPNGGQLPTAANPPGGMTAQASAPMQANPSAPVPGTMQAAPAGAMVTDTAPPPPPPPSVSVPGAPTSTINPAADLRSSLVAPGADPRLAAAQGATDAAVATLPGASDYPGAVDARSNTLLTRLTPQTALGGGTYTPQMLDASGGLDARTVAGGPAVDPTKTDPRLAAAQSFQDQATGGVQSLDRVKMAQDALDAFGKNQDIAETAQLRRLGQNSAASGTLGSGMADRAVAEELAKAQSAYDEKKLGLTQTLTNQNAADAFTKANLGRGLVSDEQGYGAQTRGEQRTERGYTTDLASQNADRLTNADTANLARRDQIGAANVGAANDASKTNIANASDTERYNIANQLAAKAGAVSGARADVGAANDAAYQKLGALTNRESTAYGQGAANRGELRDERSYQASQAQQGIENAVQQTQLEAALKSGDIQQALALLSAGSSADPSGLTAQTGASYANDANSAFGGAGDLLSQNKGLSPDQIAQILKQYGGGR